MSPVQMVWNVLVLLQYHTLVLYRKGSLRIEKIFHKHKTKYSAIFSVLQGHYHI